MPLVLVVQFLKILRTGFVRVNVAPIRLTTPQLLRAPGSDPEQRKKTTRTLLSYMPLVETPCLPYGVHVHAMPATAHARSTLSEKDKKAIKVGSVRQVMQTERRADAF